MKKSYRVTSSSNDYKIDIMEQPSGLYELTLDQQRYLVDLFSHGDGHFNLLINNCSVEIDLISSPIGIYLVGIKDALFRLQLCDEQKTQIRSSISSPTITEVVSPMAANVWKIHKQEGEPVDAGEQLITLEAMKMESEVNAPAAGILSHWFVAPGDAVSAHQPLCIVTPSK